MKIQANSGLHIWLVLWRTFKTFEKFDLSIMDSLGMHGISDFGVLQVLYYNGTTAVNEIGKKIMLTSGSITAAIDRVEKRGLVVRSYSPSDRRKIMVSLTEQGEEEITQAVREHSTSLEKAVQVLDPQEREQLVTLLKKLGLSLEKKE